MSDKMGCDTVCSGDDQDSQLDIQGYQDHLGKRLACLVGTILTVGLLRLVFYWFPYLHLRATSKPCHLATAQYVCLKDSLGQIFVAKVETTEVCDNEENRLQIKIVGDKNCALGHENALPIDLQDGNYFERYFFFKNIKYIWNSGTRNFNPVRGLDQDHRLSFFHKACGLTAATQAKGRTIYGNNVIAVNLTPIATLLCQQVLSPFYVFQLFSMCVWYADDYEMYASCIVAITIISITATVYQTRLFERTLRNTIAATTVVGVCRGGNEYEDISSEDLVPGDVIEIPRHGCEMQCDAVLISGSCISNESLLTGESVPVTKTSLPNPSESSRHFDPMLNIKQHSRHILFCGTTVVQTRFYGNQKVKAVVLRTGFLTSKGQLVRAILYPRAVDYRFQRHSYYFIAVLASLAAIGFVYTIYLMTVAGETAGHVILRALDIITIAIPPALPAALAVGVVASQMRLKRNRVYCINPKVIVLAGTIDTVCFDKTGTLTEEKLDLHGVVKVERGRFQTIEQDMHRLTAGPLLVAMATCHSLFTMENRIMGDPLDLIMFQAIDWDLEEPADDTTRFDMIVPTVVKPRRQMDDPIGGASDGDVQSREVAILRQFPFSSSLQRMSVIARSLNASHFDLYVKGSPEMISSLSTPDTVPSDFHARLETYTQHGYRVIALAWKSLPSSFNFVRIQRLTRDEVENDLEFLGLLVLENKLKPETAPVVSQLNEAKIRTIMLTGDNILTALSVARECGMVKPSQQIIYVNASPPGPGQADVHVEFVSAGHSNIVEEEFTAKEALDGPEDAKLLQKGTLSHSWGFALTGKTWDTIQKHCPSLLQKLVVKGVVFARMSPDQKAHLVELLQDVGYQVGMCGDGANDCGALKAAHMGISLSEAEASVASPFTSKTPNIKCVPRVIQEGRAALITATSVFKYMACYSLTQFICVLILYWVGSNISDLQFLYIDFYIITTFSITISLTGSYKTLVKEQPLPSLFSLAPILGIVSQTVLVICVETFVFWHIQQQSWFRPCDEDREVNVCYEKSAIFLSSIYIYFALTIAFNKGPPFRGIILSNRFLVVNVVIIFCSNLWITIYPTQWVADIMKFTQFPAMGYRFLYVGFGLVYLPLSVMVEKFWDYRSTQKQIVFANRGQLYHKIESEMELDVNWPPMAAQKSESWTPTQATRLEMEPSL